MRQAKKLHELRNAVALTGVAVNAAISNMVNDIEECGYPDPELVSNASAVLSAHTNTLSTLVRVLNDFLTEVMNED